jgi:hypothetical protein
MIKLLYLTAMLSSLVILPWNHCQAGGKKNSKAVYRIVKTDDFEIAGDGNNDNWDKAEWLHLTQRMPAREQAKMSTKMKAMYSATGIYFLFFCEDRKITATMLADFMDLWKEDVVEVFLWPDEELPFYFEYEISPLDFELPLLISNQNMELLRWQPFYYEENRKTRHATTVQGGEKKSHAEISSWTAEFFFPYKLLSPLKNLPPQEGTKWRANFYRNDYDGERASWSWQPTEKSYHEYEKFGTVVFE